MAKDFVLDLTGAVAMTKQMQTTDAYVRAYNQSETGLGLARLPRLLRLPR